MSDDGIDQQELEEDNCCFVKGEECQGAGSLFVREVGCSRHHFRNMNAATYVQPGNAAQQQREVATCMTLCHQFVVWSLEGGYS